MSEHGYKLTVGLEIHAELKTRTKMFCNSKNDPDEKRPNANVCPVCMGHPGTLPVVNKEAVRHVLRVGAALGGAIADFTEFDRKNYFYPDIPKGYQISQYQFPLVSGGTLDGVRVTRVHLEEDTARSSHEGGECSLIDFNRSGVPLMELVTEPDISSPEEASRFARELMLLLRYLGASDANMEKGEMRVEANVSVSAGKEFGTKVEVKNLNSFRSVERAIAHEFERQTSLLAAGRAVAQETRGFDEASGKTFSQRAKEESHDYRYFPDPDVPKLSLRELPEFSAERLAASLPPLPARKRKEYETLLGKKISDVEPFVEYPEAGKFLEAACRGGKGAAFASLVWNYLTSDVFRIARDFGADLDAGFRALKFSPKEFAELIELVEAKEISSRGAKDILAAMAARGGAPRALAEELGVFQKSGGGELREIARAVVAANEKVVRDFKEGKQAALQFLVGQGMKASKGSANPELLRKAIVELLA